MVVTYSPKYNIINVYRHGIEIKKERVYGYNFETVGYRYTYDGICKYDGLSIKQGISLHPTNIDMCIKFFCDDYTKCDKCYYNTATNTADAYILYDGDLNVCFGRNGEIVFFKNNLDYAPCRKVYQFKTLSKSCIKCRDKWDIPDYMMDNKWSRYYKDGFYTIDAWDFKKDTDFVVFKFNVAYMSAFAPEIFRGKSDTLYTLQKHYSEYHKFLYELEPFNTSRDYDPLTPSEREEKNKQLAEQKRKEEEYRLQIERQKEMDRYCSCCGAPHASYVANPYYLEMGGDVVMQWLCDYCYNECAQDV